MFIREIKKKIKKDGKIYEYIQHRLVESIRINGHPRQHTLLNLGKLNIPKEQHKTLANLIESNLTGVFITSFFEQTNEELETLARHYTDIIKQKRLQAASHIKDKKDEIKPNDSQAAIEPAYHLVNINSITTSSSRTIGAEHIVLSQLKELNFFNILKTCGFNEKEQKYAAAQICARMIHPSSERETARWLRNDSALDELLDIDLSHISDQILHRITDKIHENQQTFEAHLRKTTDTLFSLDNKIILYDLTNTYFESPKRKSKIAQYTKSKEKRNDCPQITLALIVDNMGFPKKSTILEGAISEPGSLWNILESLHTECEQTELPRTVVIDAGIATEENLEKLRNDPRFEYVAVSRKKQFDPPLTFQLSPTTIKMSHNNELTITTAKHENELFLRCKSPDKTLKEEAIHTQRKDRFENELRKLQNGLNKPRARNKSTAIYERIGRLKERHKIGYCYEITVHESEGKVSSISWKYNKQRVRKNGEYLLRSSRIDLGEEDFSLIHRSLTMIESAFRWLKSDLGLRPNFHQKDSRMASHAQISVLAYFFLAPILNRLNWGGEFVSACDKYETHRPWSEPYGWKGVIRTMASQTRVTTSLKCKNGTTLNVRTTLEPNSEQIALCKRLGVNSKPLKRIIAGDN